MPDENQTASGTQAEPQAAGQPQAGVPNATTTPSTPAEPSGHPSSEPMSLDEAKKLRAESASLRKRLAELEQAQQAAELAKLSEAERLQKQYQQAQEQIAQLQIEQQQYRLAREIAKHAPSLNLIDPDAAMLMLTAGGELDYDSDGKPTNVAKLLEKLVAEKPYLVATNVRPLVATVSSGGATNPSRSAANTSPAQPSVDPKELYKNRRGLANPNLWKK